MPKNRNFCRRKACEIVIAVTVVWMVSVSFMEAQVTTQWVRTFGSVADDSASGICVDSSGSVYIVGETLGSFAGQSNATPIEEQWKMRAADSFVVKYDSTGSNLWTRVWGSLLKDGANDCIVDKDGSVYVVGRSEVNYDHQTNNFTFPNLLGLADGYIAKFSSEGTRLWSRSVGTNGNDAALSCAVDPHGQVYVVCCRNADTPRESGFSGDISTDVYVIKLASDGRELMRYVVHDELTGRVVSCHFDWSGGLCVALNQQTEPKRTKTEIRTYSRYGELGSKSFPLDLPIRSYSVSDCRMDGEGNVYVLIGAAQGKSGGPALIKIDDNGNRLWINRWGDFTKSAFPYASTRTSNRFYAVESHWLGAENVTLSRLGAENVTLSAFANDGQVEWQAIVPLLRAYNKPQACYADQEGNIYVAGEYRNPSAQEIPGAAPSDVFVVVISRKEQPR